MAEVAHWLRQSRHLSGLTYEQLVRATGFSRGSLHRAASGWRSPWPVVKAFTHACGTDVGTARKSWLKAKAALEGTDQVPDVIAVGHVSTFDELRVAMGYLRVLAGRPSLRELVGRSGGRLTRSTLASVLNGTSHPRRELVAAFVDVVGVGGDEAAGWAAAWDRAQAHLRSAREATAPMEPLAVVPSPALLSVLGDLPLSDWAAVAELVDVVRKGGEVGVPASVSVDFQRSGTVPEPDTITISCPGTSIDRETIQQLFRISWAGRPQEQSKFGASFLVACLRLGSRITLRTAHRHEPAWTVFTLDLASLTSGTSWRIPIGAEPKTEAGQQGARITIEALRSVWSDGMQQRLRRHLGDVFSYVLREQRLQLTVSESVVAPRMPCIWGGNRFVQRHGQDISAVQKLDVVLATQYRCRDCRRTSPLGSSFCPQCQGTRLEWTEHRVWGWLGVQRYLHQRDYGIDFYRNGRKILVRDKRLFSFSEDPEHAVVEYPVDSPAKGRLVGEIHCDHVPVNFTHTAFDYDSPEWRGVVHAIRGPGPLAARRAQKLGFAPNTSALATLFDAFRRNDPGLRYLIPGDGVRALHQVAADWAERFHEGDPAYQSDEVWYDAALSHDTSGPAATAPADHRIDLANLDPEDLCDLVHRLYMNQHDPTEGPRELIGPGATATVFRDRPRSGERWVLQTRRGQYVVPPETVHALAGQMLDVQATRGILVTTSWFEASSHAFAARSGNIDLVDGRALKALLREHLDIEALLRLKRTPPGWNTGDAV
ncbi:restriction endonuclease [Streptomyces sp. NPDC058228]|uniref:restriction endonuclease n=1 Tax=Streptomyces sp. NPDC058228 TaxID=3346390 RepID=UPI0036E23139